MKKIIIVVGSENPVKIETTRQGFAVMFPGAELELIGVKASSGVSNQPLTDWETLRGAWGRITSARAIYPDADYYVGLEGGVEPDPATRELHEFAWIVVESRDGKQGKAKTATFIAPSLYYDLVIDQGLEVGEASDRVFDETNSKQKMGASGLLTGGAIDRKEFYRQAVIFALLPFKNPHLY